MYKYFKNVKTFDELKQQYKLLVKQFHPDLNHGVDTTSIMQEINNEYEMLIKSGLHKSTSSDNTKKTNHDDIADGYRDVIDTIINMNEIVIELIGSWVWVTGNTFNHKDALKSIGFKWSKNKKAWYWHSDEWTSTRHNKKYSMQDIRMMHGSQVIEKAEHQYMAIC